MTKKSVAETSWVRARPVPTLLEARVGLWVTVEEAGGMLQAGRRFLLRGGRAEARRGMTLLEVMVTVTVLAVAIVATLTTFATHFRGSRYTEERRIAMQYAQSKVDELRLAVANGTSLELLFEQYGPLDFKANPNTPPAKGTGAYTTVDVNGYVRNPDGTGDECTFIVGEDANNNGTLDIGEDLNGNGALDTYLAPLPGRPMGTMTVITSETPNEGDFGTYFGRPVDTAAPNWYDRNPFGVDITGNRSYADPNPSPFPLDINGDGDSGDTADGVHGPNDKRDHVVVDGFHFLPAVVTIQWDGPFGPDRLDLFAVITKETP